MKLLITVVIGMMVIYYIQSWRLWYIAKHHPLLQSIASDPRIHNLSLEFIECNVIDITQLGCPPLADISLPTISFTFTCHNMSKYICALRTAYILAQWLNFHIRILQYAKCPPQPVFH